MRSRALPRGAVVFAAALVLVTYIASAALASGFQYTVEKRLVKVGILLVKSARAQTGAGFPPSRVNLENPDPHMFWVLESWRGKPATWEFVNPLAPTVVTEEVLARWDFRYANGGGFTDPDYGSPGSRVVDLGQPVGKDCGAYWEVLLSEENFEALLGFDLLFISNHSLTAFTQEDRNLLRRLIDAGAIVLVDDCGGMRITHANAEGRVPVTDFLTTPPPPLTPDGDFLDDAHPYFGLAYFTSWGGGAGLNESSTFDYAAAPRGFPIALEFNDDPTGSGFARIADLLNPLLTSPKPLTRDDLNYLGDKQITSYRVSAYDPNELFPVVANSAFDTPTANAAYGEPHVAMGYYGEGIVIACSADVGCAIQDRVTENGADESRSRMHIINQQHNSGYWGPRPGMVSPPSDSSGEVDPSFLVSSNFLYNAVNLALKWRQGFGGPRQQGSLVADVPNALNPAADATTPPTEAGGPWVAYSGRGSGHSYTTAANNVLYVTVPVGDNELYLVAIDGIPGRDLDYNLNPDDGFQGTPAPPLQAFAYPDFDVLWAADITAGSGGATGTAPCIGKVAYSVGGGGYRAADVVFVCSNEEIQAYRALPMTPGGLVAPAAEPFAGWSGGPISLGERATGLTYSRGRLYVEVGGGTSPLEIRMYAAGTGAAAGTIEVPGRHGTIADAGAGPAIAIVQDRFNGALDETLYVPVSPNPTTFGDASSDNDIEGQILAIVLRTWDERLRPVGASGTGIKSVAGGGTVTVDNCYLNWRVRQFARFDGSGSTPPSKTGVLVSVNGVNVPPDRWDFVYDDPAATDPANVPESDGDYQQIRFVAGTVPGEGLDGYGGTTAGAPAGAQVTISYDHKLPSFTSCPINAAEAGSIKWRYLFTKRTATSPPVLYRVTNGYAHSRVAVGPDGTVVAACSVPNPAGTLWSDTLHVIRDVGYPPDLTNAAAPAPSEPKPSDGATPWNGDELDAAGSFVFWQETLRPHMGYVMQFTENALTDSSDFWWQTPSFALRDHTAVVRTCQLPLHPDDPDAGAGVLGRYASYTTVDLGASMSVTLGKGSGVTTPPPLPLREEWTALDNPSDPASMMPYGVRIFDAWTMQPINYTVSTNGIPTRWWVDPKTGTIRFLVSSLAGRRVLVRVRDSTTATTPVYYHEYHEIPPIAVGQYPAMATRVASSLVRPSFDDDGDGIAEAGEVDDPLAVYGGGAPTLPEAWITPLHVDWDSGIIAFAPGQLATSATIAQGSQSRAFYVSRVNEDFVGSSTGVIYPQIHSNAAPSIAGGKVLASGWIDAGTATPLVNGLLVLQLDPRDNAVQDTANEPWPVGPGRPAPPWGVPGAPWPTYKHADRGTQDGYLNWWAAALGVMPDDLQNPSYDLLGDCRAMAATGVLQATPRSAPAVTAGGAMTVVLEQDGDGLIRPTYQWWSTKDTVIGDQNRLVVVDSGKSMVREVTGSYAMGPLTTIGGTTYSSESYKAISRPVTLRELAYVGKPGYYYLCDSGNDQIIEIGQMGEVVTRIANRTRLPFLGDPGGYMAFYDVPGWYIDLPAGSPQTVSSPHDAYRWEVYSPIEWGGGGIVQTWRFEFDFVADTGNSRLLALVRMVPPDANNPSAPPDYQERANQHHVVWVSDPNQQVLDPTGSVLERGAALQYVTCWPLSAPPPFSEVPFDVADADPGGSTVDFYGRNFAGVVAAINDVALNTVPGDRPNPLPGGDGPNPRVDPFPRRVGPGASVVQVGRLYDASGSDLYDGIDGQIQWAFSTIYVRDGTGPTLVPFRKLRNIRYLDVQLRVGADVPTEDPAVYYITIADDEGVYPVTYYPATGPWAATAAAYPGFAVLALPPDGTFYDPDDPTTRFGVGADGYGATWWFDAQEYATTMGAMAREMNPDNVEQTNVYGPDKLPTWTPAATPTGLYPVHYTGTASLAANSTLLDDATFSWFRPVHVERQSDGRYLVTNGHERKGEILLLSPFAMDAPSDPSDPPLMDPATRRFETDYLSVLGWILPDPSKYVVAEENRNVPDIGGESYGLGQPWAATRRTDF